VTAATALHKILPIFITSDGTYTVSLTVTESLSTSNTEIRTGYIKPHKSGDANKDANLNSLDITKVERIIMLLV
jgi:PKD repeat protein